MSTVKRIIFCGTPVFALPSLQQLIESKATEVVAVITQPDRPIGRKQVLTPPPIKTLALKNAITVLQPEKLTRTDIEGIPCDFLVVVSYGQIIPKSVLSHPRIAALNVHGSLLPKWRGASPIQASIVANDTATGVTIQHMVYKLDAGAIALQKTVPITATTTSLELFKSLAELGASALEEVLNSPLKTIPQNEDNVTHCHKLNREDGKVDPAVQTAATIERLWRAYHPWPGISCILHGKPYKLLQVSLEPQKNSAPIQCAENSVLHINSLQAPSKQAITGKEWLQTL